jgi:hypothetical protein
MFASSSYFVAHQQTQAISTPSQAQWHRAGRDFTFFTLVVLNFKPELGGFLIWRSYLQVFRPDI